jgi:hypothetical protein
MVAFQGKPGTGSFGVRVAESYRAVNQMRMRRVNEVDLL